MDVDHKEVWVLKNWCFWTVVLEKTLESLLDCKEIKPVNSKGNQSWIFIGRTDAEAETSILWPPDVKNWLIRKDPDAGKDWRKARDEGDNKGWGGWMASPTGWTWVWASSGSWWWRKKITEVKSHVQFSSVAQLCSTLCDPMDCSRPGFPVHHQLLEPAQTPVHWVGHAIQPSHSLSSSSPPVFNLSQLQGLFQWVSSLHQVAKVLELQLQCQSF